MRPPTSNDWATLSKPQKGRHTTAPASVSFSRRISWEELGGQSVGVAVQGLGEHALDFAESLLVDQRLLLSGVTQ